MSITHFLWPTLSFPLAQARPEDAWNVTRLYEPASSILLANLFSSLRRMIKMSRCDTFAGPGAPTYSCGV